MESDVWHVGMENPVDDEKQARKSFGLPQKKQLVYYSNSRDASSRVDVLRYRAVRKYDITSPWSVLELETEDHRNIRIHSDYFIEMQKPSFFADMNAMAK